MLIQTDLSGVGMNNMDEKDVFKQNFNRNGWVTFLILTIYASSLIYVVRLVYKRIVEAPSFQTIGILLILIIISGQSIFFYFRLISKIRDTILGQVLSVILSTVLLALVVIATDFDNFILIGCGTLFLVWKGGQLYYLFKRQGIGIVTVRYFRNIFVVYFVFTIFAFVFGGIIDFTNIRIPIAGGEDGEQEYGVIRDRVESLEIEKGDREIIIRNLDTLKSSLESSNSTISFSLYLIIYLVCIGIIYALYKGFLVKRRIRLQDVFTELREYYSKHPLPDREGKGPGIIARFWTFIFIIRPFMSMIAALVAVAVYLATSVVPAISTVFLLFLTVFLTSGYGFALNDYFDLEKDKVEHENRILPKGLFSPITVFRFALIIGILSLLFSANISFKVFLLNLLTFFLLSIYSFINNRNGALANIITAVNASFVLLIGMLAGHYTPLILWLSFATFLLIVGREIVLDIRDINSDKAISKISIPIIYGVRNSIFISGLFFLLASLLILILALSSGNLWFKLFIGGVFNIILWLSFSYFWATKNGRSLTLFLASTRLAFLLLLPGILL